MSIRAVYDCMLFLQAASKPDRVHATFRLIETGEVSLFVSADILEEVRDVLTRPRHREKFPALTNEHVSKFLQENAQQSKLVGHVPPVYTVRSDPKDSKYVNLALAAGAQFLVSWDRHLLNLMDESTSDGAQFRQRFPALRILDPVLFLRAVDALRDGNATE